jgi:DNA-binding NarL/FixJ family response regulator
MQSKSVNLAVIDKQTLFREVLGNYLQEHTNINTVIHAPDADILLDRLNGSKLDIMVMDLFTQTLKSEEVVKIIRKEFPEIKLLVLSMCTDLYFISELLDLGIHGYILKTAEPEELFQAIIAASNGRIYRNKIFTEALYFNKQDNIAKDQVSTTDSLSDREKRILQLIWEEQSNKDIADQLLLGSRSVEKIRQGMKEKLGVRSTVGLLKYGLKEKIIEVNGQRFHKTV